MKLAFRPQSHRYYGKALTLIPIRRSTYENHLNFQTRAAPVASFLSIARDRAMPMPPPVQPAISPHRNPNASVLSVQARHSFGAMEIVGSQMTFGPNEEIFGESEPSEYVYKVVSGAVRTYKILVDGRRQIGAFYLPGDIFGLEVGTEHRFSADAIGRTVVQVVRRSAVLTLASRDNKIARELWTSAARELHQTQERMLLFAKSAQQRLAAFLLEMSERLAPGDVLQLPMSRQDIGDYLGLTIETVSRTLTQFVCESTIRLPSSRRVVVCNRNALHQLNA
jgi:CRP/FNR family nitrogen fixation transcriptional regulator